MMIITLCGSTRFKNEFLIANDSLTLDNCIVLMPGVFSHSDNRALSDKEEEEQNRLHKKKIAMSDAIYVINKDDYIGESTRSEIEFAKMLNIPVYYMEEHKDD